MGTARDTEPSFHLLCPRTDLLPERLLGCRPCLPRWEKAAFEAVMKERCVLQSLSRGRTGQGIAHVPARRLLETFPWGGEPADERCRWSSLPGPPVPSDGHHADSRVPSPPRPDPLTA